MNPEYSEEVITNRRSQKLFTVSYLPKDKPAAVFIFHHGYGEHVGRYGAVFTKLAQDGIAVYSYDAHSHGKSEPQEKALIWSFTDLVDDFADFIARVKSKVSPTPCLFIGGQSAGGLVASHAAIRDPASFAGLLLFSAAIDVQWNLTLRLLAPVGNLLAVLSPKARLAPAVRCEDMSQDPEVVKHYMEDPLNFVGPVRARTANEILKGMTTFAKVKHQLAVPLYVVHGTEDKCTSLLAVRDLVRCASCTDKTIREVPGGYHELLMGPERDDVVQGASGWIKAHLTSKL